MLIWFGWGKKRYWTTGETVRRKQVQRRSTINFSKVDGSGKLKEEVDKVHIKFTRDLLFLRPIYQNNWIRNSGSRLLLGFIEVYSSHWAFPVVLLVKNLPANAGVSGSIPGSGRSPGGGHGNLLQYSCLENPMDKATWWATVHRVTKSQTQLKWLSMHTCVIHIP